MYNRPTVYGILSVFFVICLFVSSFPQEKYSRIKLRVVPGQIQEMANAGVALDGNLTIEGDSAVLEISVREISLLKDKGYQYRVLIDDMSAYYRQRNLEETLTKRSYETGAIVGRPSAASAYTGYAKPAGFTYGSMGGFHTLTEMYAALDSLAKKYPAFVSPRQQIGTKTSAEGRPLYFVKLSNNVGFDDPTKPQVMYNALHHAREPAGMESELFFMYYLLENYSLSDSIKFLVDNTQMYFVPCVNVDGYTYNQTNSPGGGGMWRKNRRNNGDGAYGVDLNRNYGYQWKQAVAATSADDYNGPSAFSEPEDQMMKLFDSTHAFEFSISIHTYGNYMIHPWAYVNTPCPDDGYFRSAGTMLTAQNGYKVGNAYQTVGYTAVGGSLDWCYGERTVKKRIMEYSPEAGSQSDGFWPAQSRIVPNCQLNMYMNLLLARFSHGAILKDLTSNVVSSLTNQLRFGLKRLSVDPKTFRVKIVPQDKWIVSTGDSVTITALDTFQTKTDSIAYALDPAIASGQVFSFNLVFDDGKYTISRTLKKSFTGSTYAALRVDHAVRISVNPLNRNLLVRIDDGKNGAYRIAVENGEGRLVARRNIEKTTAAIIEGFSLSDLARGVYLVGVSNAGWSRCKKIVVQ